MSAAAAQGTAAARQAPKRRASHERHRDQRLGKRYGSTWVLHDCMLAIPAGHVAALVGPNGAGKTTLLNLAVGLADPTAGAVTVLGGKPAGSPPRAT